MLNETGEFEYESGPEGFSFEFFSNGIFLPAIAFAGLIGNFCLLRVFCRRGNATSRLRPFVIYLAFCDIALLLHVTYLYAMTAWLTHRHIGSHANMQMLYSLPYAYMMANFCYMTHIWATVALTFERHMAICHPLWHRIRMPRRCSCIMLALLTLLTASFSVIRYFEMYVQEDMNPETNETEISIQISDLMEKPAYLPYRLSCKLTLTSFGPILIMYTLTIRMIYALKKQKAGPRRSLSRAKLDTTVSTNPSNTSNNNDIETRQGSNGPLIAILIMAVVCYTLPTIADVLDLINEAHPKTIDLSFLHRLIIISNLLVVFDASANFYVYWAFCYRFRQLLHSSASDRLSAIRVSGGRVGSTSQETELLSPLRLTVSVFNMQRLQRNQTKDGGSLTDETSYNSRGSLSTLKFAKSSFNNLVTTALRDVIVLRNGFDKWGARRSFSASQLNVDKVSL